MEIEDVLRRNEERLMSIPGVVGVGIGEINKVPTVIVMVKKMGPELKKKIPDRLEGFGVKIEETGEITAF